MASRILERFDVRRVILALSDEGQAGKARRRSLTAFVEAPCQVPCSIPCDRVSLANSADTAYVTPMAAHLLNRESPLPSVDPSEWAAEFDSFRVLDNGKQSRLYKQHRLAFFLSRKADRVVTIEDWLVLRVDRHVRREEYFDVDAVVCSLIHILLYGLPLLPDLVGRLEMPAGVPIVMPLVLKFFASKS